MVGLLLEKKQQEAGSRMGYYFSTIYLKYSAFLNIKCPLKYATR